MMAGLLETLLKPVTATAGAISRGLLPYQKELLEMRGNVVAGTQARLAEMLQAQQERTEQRLASQQAPGLAQALGTMPEARGLQGAGGQIGAGWDQLPPEVAAAVRLQMNPQTRQLGNSMAGGLLDPQQRQGLANARQQGELLGVQTEAAQFGLDQARREGPLALEASRQLIASRRAAALASQASAEAAAAGRIDPLEARINQRWLANLTEPVAVQDSLQQIEGTLRQGDSLGALASIIKLAKILDPTSVVREGEVVTVEGGTGLAQQLLSGVNRLKGGGLSPKAAADVLRTAKTLAVPVLERGQRLTGEVRQQALDYGVEPDRVTTGIGWQSDYVSALLEEAARAR